MQREVTMNEIRSGRLALATSLVVAGLYVACWGLVLAIPEPAMALTEDMLHMRMQGAEWNMTPRSLVLGGAAWVAIAGGAAWLIGRVYNRLCRQGA